MDSTSAAISLSSWSQSGDAGGDSVTASECPAFFRDLVCRVLLLVGVVGGLSISVFVGVASIDNVFL